jgi:superfamily II DNA or RNA helicase
MKITDHHAKYFAYELTKRCPSDSLEKLSSTLSNAQVDLNPHQIEAALFAFRSPLSKGAILADEVGLGKTIEAGLVLSQKWAERKRKILLIVPSSLRKQWNDELSEKFFLPSVILEAKSFNQYIKDGNLNPFNQEDKIIICSYHFARSKASYIKQTQWDLAVIDEAHRLRNVYKTSNKIAREIKNALAEVPKILLTATPLQNSLLELYGLVSIIDDHVFGDLKSFKSNYARVSREQDIYENEVGLVEPKQEMFVDLRNRLKPVCIRTLRRQVLEYINYTERKPITQDYVPTEQEVELYDGMSEYLQRAKLYALPFSQRRDVANIYTIAPIRASAAQILTEQTIGRGLRLPYGEKTGNKNVDRVMIVAHDNYAKVIEEAQHSKLIQPSNIESISTSDTKIVKEVIEVQSVFVTNIEEQIKASPAIMQEIEAQAMKTVSAVIGTDIPEDVVALTVRNKVDEIVEIAAKNEARKMSSEMVFDEGSLFNMLSEPAKQELENIGRISRQTIEVRNIPIPRLMLTPHYGELIITDFDLDTKKLSRYATDASILEQSLQGKEENDLFGGAHFGQRETELTRVSSLGEGRAQSSESTILAALVEEPLIDYDDVSQTSLLLKLTKQAVDHYRSFVSDNNALKMMVENNFRLIAKEIYDQILTHKDFKSESYLESGIREARPYLEQYNISRSLDEKPVTLESQIDRFSRDKIYTGFKKACHSMYKFDSSDEARMAYLLDMDSSVKAWLRPAPNQFDGLYWRDEVGNSQHRYEPDFVVELANEIVMIEVKPGVEIKDIDVQEKKKTADKYCELVSKNIGKYGITKPWRYVIVPTEKITVHSTVTNLLT